MLYVGFFLLWSYKEKKRIADIIRGYLQYVEPSNYRG